MPNITLKSEDYCRFKEGRRFRKKFEKEKEKVVSLMKISRWKGRIARQRANQMEMRERTIAECLVELNEIQVLLEKDAGVHGRLMEVIRKLAPPPVEKKEQG